jgi:hypothetical protein
MMTLPRISPMAYHKKQNVYHFIPAGSFVLSFCVGPFVMAYGTTLNPCPVCAVHLTFDMKVIFQMFEETLQRT